MRDKLPPDFDADWYGRSYPDVALSGLSPREHYRRFGTILGRPSKGSPAPPPEPAAQEAETTQARSSKQKSASPSCDQTLEPQPAVSPIIDRPEGFDPAATVLRTASPKPGGGPDGVFSLDTLVTGAGADENPAPVLVALQNYARLLGISSPGAGTAASADVSCGAKPFQAGPSRIENAWFVEGSTIRLALAGRADDSADSNAYVLRAYQSRPGTPAELQLLGPGVVVPAVGPTFHELNLLSPLMPLLIELSRPDGVSRAFALIPFPSLLPGGIHGAELKALQLEPNPMDAFWALSEAMLHEVLGADDPSARSVVGLLAEPNGSTEDQLLLSSSFQEWLTAVFRIPVRISGAADEPAGAGRRRDIDSATASRGLQLVLPSEFVPTISALVSRPLRSGAAAARVSYLVAETDTFRPLWSIALPADAQPDCALPLLRPLPTPGADSTAAVASAPVPLAIALRSRTGLPASGSIVGRDEPDLSSAGAGSLTVLIHASDEARVSRLIATIRSALGGEVELIVSVARGDSELRAALDRICGGEGWKEVPDPADLREIGREARGEILVTVSDRIEPADGRTVVALLDLLQRYENAASVSCALLAEKIIKKEVVLQPASGGIFPTGVSFVGGPHLSFGEPDALQALPNLTYPVAANTRYMTVWRSRALADLAPAPRAASVLAEDIRIGLDLMRAGYTNWCTTKLSAQLHGPYIPCDTIDPVGPGYLPPESWQDILGRVTVVRELF